MKKITKSLVIVVWTAVFMTMLLVSAFAESIQVTLSYNAEYFVNLNDRHNKQLPTYLYNGGEGSTISIIGGNDSATEGVKQEYEFILDSTVFPINKNDVLEITNTKKTVILPTKTFEELPTKYIGIIANTSARQSISADIVLEFDDGTKKTFDTPFTINSMFTAGTYSCSYGQSLKTESSGTIKKYDIKSDPVYFNLIEINTASLKQVTSIEFGTAELPYHVIAVVEIPYTQAEKEMMEEETIVEKLPEYENKLLSEIIDTHLADLSLILGTISAEHEKYNHINNLYVGYSLYKEQSKIKADYDTIINENNYLEFEVSDIYGSADEDVHIENIKKLILLHETQEESVSKREQLETIFEYFEPIDSNLETEIFLVESEKTTLLELLSSYEFHKEKKELEAQIKSLYDTYKTKTSTDLDAENDLAELDKLLKAYDKADEIGVAYNVEEKAYIIELVNNYNKFIFSEKPVFYDLSSHYNRGITANEGDRASVDWGTDDRITDGDKTLYKTGIRKSRWDSIAGDGIVTAIDHINMVFGDCKIYSSTGIQITEQSVRMIDFKVSTNTNVNDKNAIALKSEPIILKGSGRMASHFNFLSFVGTNVAGTYSYTVLIKHTDGTEVTWNVELPYNGYGSVPITDFSDLTKPYIDTDGTVKLSNQKVLPRVNSLPIEEGKIIDTVEIKFTGTAEGILIAVTEEVIKNEKYEELFKNQFDKVKNYEDSNFNKDEALKFSLYCAESEKRGLDISSILGDENMDKVNYINNKVLVCENEFEKTDKNTVKSIIKFSNPVDPATVKDNLTVTANGKTLTDVSEFSVSMTDDKTGVVTILDKELGGVEYKVLISDELTLRDYPEITILTPYEFTYTSPAYLEASLIGLELTVKNNTKTSYSYKAVATAISEDKKTILGNDEFSDTVSALDENTHTLSSTSGNFFASIWDNNQKLILNVSGGAEATTAQTVTTEDYMYPTLEFETNELKIAGITPSKQRDINITLDILKDSASFMKKEAKTNKDGYFEIKVALNEDLIPSGTMLSFTLGGDDFSGKVNLYDVYFSTKTQRMNRISELINDSSIIKQESTKDILALDKIIYEGIDLDKAEITINANKSLLSASDITGSRDNLRKLLILSAFNQNKKDIVSKDGIFLYEDLMKYTSEIDKNGSTIYSLYQTVVTDAGKSVTVDSLLNKNILTLSSFYNLMAENMLVNELEYPKESGVVYVSDVLTTQNAERISLSIPKYFGISDKTAINTAIANNQITSKNDIVTTVTDFSIDSGNNGGGTTVSGGFTNSSSSVSNLGIDKPYINSLINQNNEANGATVFKDVPKNHWAYSYISELFEKNVLSGKGNNTFAPEDGLTRAELVKIIVIAKDLKQKDATLPFTDVTYDSWYMPYIKAAYENGVITGVTENTFAPNEEVSRQDLCVVLYRLLSDKQTGDINFNDSENIAPYALDAVKCFVNLGILNGFEDGSFRANEGCTRAQCAKIISMFLKK